MATRIFWIAGLKTGRLAISARPCGGDGLPDDVDDWKQSGVNTVVSLLGAAEIRELDLGAEEALCRAAGIDFISFPVVDRGVPESTKAFIQLIHSIEKLLADGESVLIHCRVGIGRSAVLAALVLVAQGEELDAAFDRISAARKSHVPDTAAQRTWAERLAEELTPAGLRGRPGREP